MSIFMSSGVSAASGSLFLIWSILSRISLVAVSILIPHLNLTLTKEIPSIEVEVTSSTFSTDETRDSINSVTRCSTS